MKKRLKGNQRLSKLYVRHENVEIKIEPNEVLRGIVYPSQRCDVLNSVEDRFGLSVTDISILSFEDLYAGKICAALDRQHPRDLFDVKLLFDHEGVTDKLRQAFVVYLASNSRPMSELLMPNLLDISLQYRNEFDGTSSIDTSLDDLLRTRKQLIETINNNLTQAERLFLLSIKAGTPNWDYLSNLPDVKKLPAIQWKLHNIRRMNKDKQKKSYEKLKRILRV